MKKTSIQGVLIPEKLGDPALLAATVEVEGPADLRDQQIRFL